MSSRDRRFSLGASLAFFVVSLVACGGDPADVDANEGGGGGVSSNVGGEDAPLATTSTSTSTSTTATTSSGSGDGGGDEGGAGPAGVGGADPDPATTSTGASTASSTTGAGGAGGAGGGTGGGGVPKDWDFDPCESLKPTLTKPTGKTSDGRDMWEGTNGKDVIFGGDGNDLIKGNGGDDVLCGGNGEDEIYGGDGEDYIDGGRANDLLYGNGGADLIHGRSGSDDIYGGAGNDLLLGDILDDHMFGEDGDDVMIGGHGVDAMHGGEGDDWLRGDTNGDEFVGGAGHDTVSFATATPPGQPIGSDFEGVTVDLNTTQKCKLRTFASNAPPEPCGMASGDGANEPLVGIETVIGSAFRDRLVGNGKSKLFGGYGDDVFVTKGNDVADGGPGLDKCNGKGCNDANEPPSPKGLFVFVDTKPKDPGLFVLGSDGADALKITTQPTGILVTSTNGQAIQPGRYCAHVKPSSAAQVLCKLPGDLAFLLGWGGNGPDAFTFGDGFGNDFTAHVDGGAGSDELVGGAGGEVFFAGRTGADVLRGNGGQDALISEGLEDGSPIEGDVLDGGAGDDQLVVDNPCGGHTYIGGPGLDIAGFARAGSKHRIVAQLGGQCAESHRQPFYGKAYDPKDCGGNKKMWTTLGGDLEVLEGADLNDELHGNDLNNIIWGREGNDLLRGWGGEDYIRGAEGDDVIHGDGGADWLFGNAGTDYLHAKDGQKDHVIDCSGGFLKTKDPGDPNGAGCQ